MHNKTQHLNMVYIYKPTKTATQSGIKKSKIWKIKFHDDTNNPRDDVMGWTSTDDTRSQINITFKTLDDAKKFAEEQGWEYHVLPTQERHYTLKSYSDNFQRKH